jgi:hypothetical protein
MKKTILLALLALIACSLPSGAKNFASFRNDYRVTCMAHDGQNLYVGTRYGLIAIDKATGMQTFYNSSNSALPNDYVGTLLFHDSALWIGLDTGCVSKMTTEGIINYQYPFRFSSEDFYFPVSCIAFGLSGDLYVSQFGYLIRIVDGSRVETVPVGSTNLETAGIEEVKVDANGVLWIADYEGGYLNYSLSRYTPEEGLVYPMADFDESLFPLGKNMMDSRAMDIDADGHVWIGCRGGYLAEYDGETFRFYELIVGVSQSFGDLAFDANGTLWCIAYDGRLISRSGEEITVRQLELVEGEHCDILHIDGDTVYVGTNKRLIAWHDGQQTNIELTTSDYPYHPFLKEGKVWNCKVKSYAGVGEWETSLFALRICGDSIVGGQTYKKMYRDDSGGSTTLWRELWREEGRKVYAWSNGKEELRYDFSLTPGGVAAICGEVTTALCYVDTVETLVGSFRRYHVSNAGAPANADRVWVEGIGHPGGPYRVWGMEVNDGTEYTLLSVYEDGECIFTQDDFNAPTEYNIDAHYVFGIVRDEEGQPVAGATVTLYAAYWSYGAAENAPVVKGTTDADGRYRIRIEDRGITYFPEVTALGHVILDYFDLFIVTDNLVKDYTLYGSVTYRAGVRSTLTLPFDPDPTVGRYYTLAGLDGKKVVFKRVLEPQANQPYVLFADRDYHVSLEGYDLTAVRPGSVGFPKVCFFGTYYTTGYAPDDAVSGSMTSMGLDESRTTGIGYAAHAMLEIDWELAEDCELVFDDTPANQVDSIAYRPFVEEDKVWKVGAVSGNPVPVVDYYYFDGDTIIGGKTFKQMMCQRYVSPDYPYYDDLSQQPSLTKVGAWREEDKKVYFYDEGKQTVVLKYDFSIGDNESLQLIDDYPPFIIGPKQTGGLEGFKGVYRDVMVSQAARSTTWLEGVGGIDGPTRNAYPEAADHVPELLMSCAVGDEVIYLNDNYEDGATPAGARKGRFDFTHTVKTKPKAPRRSEEQQSLYGEYNDLRLVISLDPLCDDYLVSITGETGQVVYQKAVDAGSIVGLSIDISAYAKGRYTVTVENSSECFTGQFEMQVSGVSDAVRLNDKEQMINDNIVYNLQGQRLRYLQKGWNIVNGRKIYIKN